MPPSPSYLTNLTNLTKPLSLRATIAILILSFSVVAFGQPAWSWPLGIVTAVCGYACMWRILLTIPKWCNRFLLGTVWFMAIQCVQLSWFLSHPYLYIYAAYLLCTLLMGLQWGLLSILIQPAILSRWLGIFALAGFWTILEWSRLFWFSGLPFNPVGLTLTVTIYPLQLASLAGVYGLSFWVILTNLSVLKIWLTSSTRRSFAIFISLALFPYLFGILHFYLHSAALKEDARQVQVVLVQPGLLPEENLSFKSAYEARQFVLDEWHQILLPLSSYKYANRQYNNIDPVSLIVFPEYLVPYGTFYPIFPKAVVQNLFLELFGDVTAAFPLKNALYEQTIMTDRGLDDLVSNAYFAQTIANIFESHVVLGLQDTVYIDEAARQSASYSAAFHFIPNKTITHRYEKRILVPLGEYIPFEWCRKWAALYGVTGTFNCGTEAKVFDGPVPFSTSICYEEIYGNIMRQSRQKGAQLLVNLTNDGWFPNSRLPQQHFDHARLRTIENGIPLVRACNTGVTAAVDSFGQIIATLGKDTLKQQTQNGVLAAKIPLYHYHTLYSQFGDYFILAIASLFLLLFFIRLLCKLAFFGKN